tara:strand:- start:10 stop:246 length:237 start_codon:yes stop_codon:yes gene_type:complete
MSTIYEELYPPNNVSWIVFTGQLVAVKRNCFEQLPEFGIIIGCACPNFGVGYDEDYWVFLNGKISRVKSFMIYPVDTI